MRKSPVSRLFFFAAMYCVLFFALVYAQFNQSRAFTYKAGPLVVQGRFIRPTAFGRKTEGALNGGVSVFFGGIEFDFGRNDPKGFTLVSSAFGVKPAEARSIRLSDNGIVIGLEDGPDISVNTQYSGGILELVIEAGFPPPPIHEPDEENETPPEQPYAALQIPYRPLQTSGVKEGAASFTLGSEGVQYAFTRNAGPAHILHLEPGNRVISYRAIPERKTVNPADFILAGAKDPATYAAVTAAWLDKSYLAWNKAAGSSELLRAFSASGEAVNAYMSEALTRGTYRAAAAALALVYAPSVDSWETSAYAGKLDTAFRYLSAFEREHYTRLARYFNEKSGDFLKDFHVIAYLGTRGYGSLLDDAADTLRNFDPAVMTLEQSAGFLEGRFDWEAVRPETENPFTRFLDQAFFVLNDSLRKSPQSGSVLVFSGKEADIELNLRLGASLLRFDDAPQQELGRSLVLSVLSLADDAGSVPGVITRGDNGNFSEKPAAARLASARMYHILGSGDYYAGAAAITVPSRSGLWAWTASPQSLKAAETAAELDIEVYFPAGETHYMMLRGIRPFARLQLYGVDLSPDPQFERYDGSGWVYLPQEQALLLKVRHRSVTEHIKLLQTPAPARRDVIEAPPEE